MHVRIVDGADAPWEGHAAVNAAGIVIDGDGYCPLDDLHGVVIVEFTDEERELLIAHGFDLPVEQ